MDSASREKRRRLIAEAVVTIAINTFSATIFIAMFLGYAIWKGELNNENQKMADYLIWSGFGLVSGVMIACGSIMGVFILRVVRHEPKS